MKTFEVVREIFNQCSGNQMRDVSIFEASLDDPEVYLRNLLKGNRISIEKEELSDGSIRLSVDCDGLLQRFSFTEDS